MYTGLIEQVGTVAGGEATPSGRSVLIDHGGWERTFTPGESISISGCCLTLVEAVGTVMRFDAIPETLSKTTLGGFAVGDRVNLEQSLRADSLLGGHLVQGHVDGVGQVTTIADDPEDWRLTVCPPADLMACMAPKGSVTLDGVSLTLAEVDAAAGTITVALIPTTLDVTTLRDRKVGDAINIEADIIAKAVQHQLRVHGIVPA